jgi:hypothetical protein
MELGWQPKEEFDADPKNQGKRWRSADDFMDRKPLFDKIDLQGRELKQVKQALQQLANQNKEVEKLAYKRAIEDLKAQKVQALEESDHARVVEIDERMVELKTAAKEVPPDPQQQNPAFVAWVEQNKWYANDKEMRSVADGIGLSLAREGVPPEEIMTQVTNRIKRIFSDKFERSRVPPNPDSGGSRKTNGKSNVPCRTQDHGHHCSNGVIQRGVSEAVRADSARTI